MMRTATTPESTAAEGPPIKKNAYATGSTSTQIASDQCGRQGLTCRFGHFVAHSQFYTCLFGVTGPRPALRN